MDVLIFFVRVIVVCTAMGVSARTLGTIDAREPSLVLAARVLAGFVAIWVLAARGLRWRLVTLLLATAAMVPMASVAIDVLKGFFYAGWEGQPAIVLIRRAAVACLFGVPAGIGYVVIARVDRKAGLGTT